MSCYGPGVFRVRAGPNTRPDYGIVVGRTKPCAVAQPAPGTWTFTSGDATLEITGSPLRFRLLLGGKPVVQSITDQHFRGWTRLPAFGRVRAAPDWIASLALASGEAVYGLGEKFGSLDKRGQLIHSARRRRARREHRALVQEHAVRVEPGHRRAAPGACSSTRPRA